MKWQYRSIRTRLFVAYMSIILVGFAAMTVIAGNQIAVAARADYDEQLLRSANLIAQGLAPLVEQGITEGEITEALLTAIEAYESDTNITIELVGINNFTEQNPPEQFDEFIMSNLARNRMVVRRDDENGNSRLYTAIAIFDLNRRDGIPEIPDVTGQTDGALELPTLPAFLVFSVPYENLLGVIAQRWVTLIILFLLVAILTIIASLWVAQTIIHPLYTLRDTAVRLAQGEFSHRIKDVTKDEIGEVSEAFNEMARQVETMLEEQRAFASNTSHELRTPLTTIRLRTEALRYDELDDRIKTLYIEEIDNEVVRMSSLIEDLTLLSRFDANRAELGQSHVDIGRFAESLIERLTRSASDKNISLTLEKPEELPVVIASINHLTIIFRNIIDNAIKYTPENGAIFWQITSDAQYIVSTIIDTGRGIESENLERIFMRFYRVDTSHSRSIQGTGLGLTLVKSIVEAYHGQITIDSDGLNSGTTVTIKLPSN